jgi:putative SOS response-associated peptidase YedK
MCGRFAITSTPEAIRLLLDYLDQPNFPPRHNIAPTQPIGIVRLENGQRRFALVRWGLLPSWVKDPKSFTLLINARGDTVNEKPAFRNAMKYRRCLIPADGFYEWKGEGPSKVPYYVRLKSGQPFAFAGLWETWTGPNGEEMETAAIVTTQANQALRPIHHRMPVVLPPEAYDPWLDTSHVDAAAAHALIAPAPDGLFDAYEVSKAVNRVANDFADLTEPATNPPASPHPGARMASKRAPKTVEGQGFLF